MKYFSKFLLPALMVITFFAACDKAQDVATYGLGTTPTLNASASTVAASATDSNKVGLILSWNNPKYATDSATQKFIVEIDSTGRNFSKAISKTVVGAMTTSFTNKELNTILLGYGFAFNTAYDVDVRVTSSYGNNNEQYKTNVLKIKMTPYVIPPKVAPPASGHLYLVGDATVGGWNNPVPVPTQEFGKIDALTYVGVFTLSAAHEYLVLPLNGDWTNKFSVANKSLAGLNAGGDFGYNLSDNFPGPTAAGNYKITIDFQAGKFKVEPYVGPSIPNNLYIVGDATPGGWNNPVPTPSQQFTRLNSVQYQIASLPINVGAQYLLLPVNGDWSNKYAVNDNTIAGLANGGYFGYNFSQNFPGPTVAGNYKFDVNFGVSKSPAENNTAQFKATKL
ncbi:MAG: SusE domain-containing protein [Ferruginibacter sp.]